MYELIQLTERHAITCKSPANIGLWCGWMRRTSA